MKIKAEINHYIYLEKKENDSVFIYARPNWGKTLAMESLVEEYHRAGYTVLILSDVKDEIEFGYAMFEPQKPYHINHLRKIGKPIETKDVKLYHPFTFNIPTNKLPEINFYGFSLKELRRNEWSLLAETKSESETIRLLLNASSSINKSDGLYSFLHYVEKSVRGKKGKKGLKPDPNLFYLKVTSATAKGLKEISSYLLPFKKDYFLVPDNSILKLNWKNIFNDNHHYHVFISNWIDDEKRKAFCILCLIESIVRNKKFCKKPCLIVIPEIRFLVPFNAEGYEKFLADTIKKRLSTYRSMGKGFSGIFDSQVWSDVEEDVRKSGTFSVFGELGGASDIEKLSKALHYRRDEIEQLSKMDYGQNSFLIQGMEKEDPFTMWYPGHMHAEAEYNFFEMYKLYFPEKMRTYTNLIETMKKELLEERNKFKEIVKREEKEEKRKIVMKKLEKKQGDKKEYEDIKKKKKKIEEKSKFEKMKLIYDYKKENPDESWREISRKFNCSHITAKKYYLEYKENVEGGGVEDGEEEGGVEKESEVDGGEVNGGGVEGDFEDKVIDEMNSTKSENHI